MVDDLTCLTILTPVGFDSLNEIAGPSFMEENETKKRLDYRSAFRQRCSAGRRVVIVSPVHAVTTGWRGADDHRACSAQDKSHQLTLIMGQA